MMRRALSAVLAACALLAAPVAEATPANGFPVVTGVVGDFVCGYAAASPFGIQCYTIANVAAKAASTPPGGSTTQVQYNNGGSFSGIAGFTWNGSTLTLPSTTLPDAGTLTSSLNTFAKPLYASGAAATELISLNSGGSHFGSIYAIGSDSWALGYASSSSGTPGNPIVNWSTSAGTNNLDLTVNGAIDLNGNFNFKDATGATTWATGVYSSGFGKLTFPTGSVLKFQSAGFSADPAAGGNPNVDLGNGTAGDVTGRLNLGALSATTEIDPPSVVGLQVDLINTTTFRIGQPLTLVGGNRFATPATATSQIGEDSTSPGGGLFLLGKAAGVGQGPQSIYSPYSNSCAIGMVVASAWTSICMEQGGVGTHGEAVEIGSNAMAQSMSQTTMLWLGDQIVPAGSIQHYTVTAGGSGYTTGTVSASLSGGGCTTYPTLIVTVLSGAVTAIGTVNGNLGAGCTSPPTVTISDSGAGTGATATSTIVTGTSDANLGPLLLFRGALGSDGGISVSMGLGPASIARPLNPDLRYAATFGGWGHSFSGTANGTQPYLRMPGGVLFERPNGGNDNGTFVIGEAIQDCNNPTIGTPAAGMLCVTTDETTSGSLAALAPIKVSFERQAAVTLSALGTADPSPQAGDRAFITDATACTFGSTVTGSGATKCPVYYDGAAWKAG